MHDWPAAQSVWAPQVEPTSLFVWQYFCVVCRYAMVAQLRYCTSVRTHSSAVLHGRRHTPSRHALPAAQSLSREQNGCRRVSTWHTPLSAQKKPEAQSEAWAQRFTHVAFTQRRFVPHSASRVH